MGEPNEAAGQVPGEVQGGSQPPAPGAGSDGQGGVGNRPAEGDGDRLAGVVQRIREGRFSSNDEEMFRRWNEGFLERDTLAQRVKELEGRPDELAARADELLAQVPIEDQYLYRSYREEHGDWNFVTQMLRGQDQTSQRSDAGTPPEEPEEDERFNRLTGEVRAMQESFRSFMDGENQRKAHQQFDTLLKKALSELDLDDKEKEFLRKDVEAQARVIGRDIRAQRRPNVPIEQLVPTVVKERAEALSGLLSARGESVKTGLVQKTEPANPALPAVPRPVASSEELAGMDVDEYWDAQMGQGGSEAPAEGAAG